ncbi:MAG TPA: sugar-binding domain-containing protein [Trueperaceae bacterium]|nr:sugar-binding domain-containing protein [Trueperaceae bacterium]
MTAETAETAKKGDAFVDPAFDDALKVARMYYHLGITTTEIARQLGVARPTISRLLGWARSHGLVEFKIIDHRERQLALETRLEQSFDVADVKVVPLHPDSTVAARQSAVASFTAHYLNSLMTAGTTITLAWGATVSLLAKRLIPKPLAGVNVVQMNGSGNSGLGITYAADIVAAFADNFAARAHLLPIPAYFDDPATKQAMFKERAIARTRTLSSQADIALYSIGVPDADSYIYRAGYVEQAELGSLREQGVVGDIATVFFRRDGSYDDIAINGRSSGPDLASLASHRHAICLVAGNDKIEGVRGALHGRFLNTLVIDEPSAEALLAQEMGT